MTIGAGVLALALAGRGWAQEKPEDAAEASAKNWLAFVDQGSYDRSWDAAAKSFKATLTKAQWAQSMKAVVPLGKLLSRKVKSRQFSTTLPGAPDGEYVVIQYDSSFDNKKEAIETIFSTRDPDGVWRVSGYFVK
jgi:hypothetical protein